MSAPHLALAADGAALATWEAQDGTGTTATSGSSSAARPAGAVRFGGERAVASARTPAQRPSQVGPPVAYAKSRILAVVQRPTSATADRAQVAAVFGDIRGHLGAAHPITTQDHVRGAQAAGNSAGRAAIVWWQDRGVFDDRVFVALRSPAGAFGRPILLSTERVRSVAVAVSPRGDVLVAWDVRGRIRTRIRDAGGHAFHTAQTLTSRATYNAHIRAAMTVRGRAYVAWTAQSLSEGGDSGAFTAEAAVRPVGAARFRAAQLLEWQQTGARQAGLDLAVDGDTAALAWSGLYAGRQRVRAASTNAHAVFGGPQDVSAVGTDASQPTLAVDGGRRLVAWIDGDGDAGGRVTAAFAPPGRPFGDAESVSAGPGAREPDAAFARGGRPTIVWSNRPAGSSGPIAAIRTYAQAANREER